MCCLFAMLVVLGPRFAIFFWWIFDMNRWDHAFDTFIIPFLGFLFLPWTTLMFVAVAPFGNVDGWDWFWLALAFATDIFSYSSSGYGNRNRIPGYGATY